MNPLLLALVPILAGAQGEISAGIGANSNPFELPGTTAPGAMAPRPASYVPLHAFGDVHYELRESFRIGLRAALDGDLYTWVARDPVIGESANPRDASHGTATVAAPFSWLGDDGARRLTLTVEPFAGAHRETFTSPVTARPYVAGGISFGRRFDTNRAGGKLSGEFELGPTIDTYAAVSYQRVDYLEDYRGIPSVDSWDHGELRVDADAWAYPRGAVLSAAYSFRRRDYDARFPHDVAGNRVLPGTGGFVPQVFYFHDATLKAGFEGDAGHAFVRADFERRIDAFAGYLSYTDLGAAIELRVVSGAWTIAAQPGFSVRFYDTARVNYDPLEPVNRRVRLDASGSVERALSATTSLWLQAGWTDQSTPNALYSFSAVRAATGVRLRWR